MDKILIKNLRVLGILGVNEGERTTLRDIVISVTLFADTRRAGQTDNLTNCVDYSQVIKEIQALVVEARRFTVEALAEDVANLCLSRPGVRKVTVRIEKPGAVANAESWRCQAR